MPVSPLLAFLAIAQPTADAVVDAFKANSFPLKSVEAGKGLEDMQGLKAILKDVKIVGMGEPTHGSREVFQMKHRMFEFLVKEMGYTIFALEASMPDCVAMDQYVMTGKGDVNAAIWAQGFWTWATEEVADLLRWMRKYNEDPAHTQKLRVVGVDMQNRFGAAFFLKSQLAKVGVNADEVLDPAMKYPRPELDLAKIEQTVKDVLPAVKEKLGAEEMELTKQVGVVLRQAYFDEKSSEWTDTRRKVLPYLMAIVRKSPALLSSHGDLKGDALAGMRLLEKSSKSVYQPTKEEEQNLRNYAKAVREYAANAKADKDDLGKAAEVLDYFGMSFEGKGTVDINWRDKCMAENTEWVIKTLFPGQKAMLWAHNMHIARFEQPQMNYRWMGAYLTDLLKSAYYPVGFSFYQGSFQAMSADMSGLKEWTVEPADKGTLDETLNQVGQPRFFLDFGKLGKDAQAWLNEPRSSRSIGAVYSPDYAKQYFMATAPRKLFDGMIFIQKTTRAKPLPRRK